MILIIAGVLRTLTCRLYPNRLQEHILYRYLAAGRAFFNRSLDARIFWYDTTAQSISFYDQCADLAALRKADEFWGRIPSAVLRDAIRRLDKSFKAFFRRVKSGQASGFPRFKSESRWTSFIIHECGDVVRGNRIRVSGIEGLIRARNLRPITGKIKEQRIVRKAGKWFCQLVVETQDVAVEPSHKPAVGIDVGLKSFGTLSDGTAIANPRFGKKAERKLAHAHRMVSRTKKGSKNRRKAVSRLQQVYLRIQNLRHNFTHQESRKIANAYGVIAVEDLNVRGMVRSRFAKSILDACWSQFTSQLAYKAEEAGGVVVRVNPAGTSQDCSECGQTVPKDLSVRVHECSCGCVLNRDVNAARNILRRALDQHRPAVGGSVMPVEGSVATPMKQEAMHCGQELPCSKKVAPRREARRYPPS